MYSILFTGPESTGKTQIARQLAAHYATQWVPEYARQYLQELDRPYRETDLVDIARGQITLEDRLAPQADRMLFCDTGMIVMKVWSEYKFRRCHPWILDQLHTRNYELIVLCGIDIPWEPDPQRENPEDRGELYLIYQNELRALGRPFIELSGSEEERFRKMVSYLDNHLAGDT